VLQYDIHCELGIHDYHMPIPWQLRVGYDICDIGITTKKIPASKIKPIIVVDLQDGFYI
jgi:hypothetical protein